MHLLSWTKKIVQFLKIIFNYQACFLFLMNKIIFYFSWVWLSQDFISLKAQVDFIIREVFYFSWVWLSQDFISLKAQVDFIIREVLNNFQVLHVSNPPCIVPPRNTKVQVYVVPIFGFEDKYMVSKYDNVILFHNNEHHVLKNFKGLGWLQS